MKQRVPRRAWYGGGAVHRARILVEDDQPALAISDFSLLGYAGFDVAFCSGPGSDPGACPLLAGCECPVAARADVVLHGLDPRLGIAAAIRRRHPATAVLIKQPRLAAPPAQPVAAPGQAATAPRPAGEPALEVPPGCVPLPFGCSVPGQVDAARRAVPC
jgi:hypothetical protein